MQEVLYLMISIIHVHDNWLQSVRIIEIKDEFSLVKIFIVDMMNRLSFCTKPCSYADTFHPYTFLNVYIHIAQYLFIYLLTLKRRILHIQYSNEAVQRELHGMHSTEWLKINK